MWINRAVALMTVLAPGPSSGAEEPAVGAGGPDGYISYTRVQAAPEPRIWLDRGVDQVLSAGDRVRIYYRTDVDAYVAILQIDTDGTTRMLYPRYPTENHYARADRDYRLLFPRSAYWNVDDRPGLGYFFIVTSPTPFDLTDFRYSQDQGAWDLSVVGSTVYSDPYVAMDDYVARLVPDWEVADYGLDFISYNVGGAHTYPRFLCYQCHGFRPYNTWNPYRYSCVNFRVIVYDDPYFYPSRRYRADRVVMAGPRNPTLPRFEFKERVAGDRRVGVTVVRRGNTDRSIRGGDRPTTDPGPRRGRVAPPPVTPGRTATPRQDPPGRGDSSRSKFGEARAVPPPAGDATTRRPTLERRPSPTPKPERPSTRRRDARRSEPAARPPTPSSTRRSPATSGGSSSSRPAPRSSTRRPPASSGGSSPSRAPPRSRSGTPPASGRATRSPQGRPRR
jgi:hypothetical protein